MPPILILHFDVPHDFLLYPAARGSFTIGNLLIANLALVYIHSISQVRQKKWG